MFLNRSLKRWVEAGLISEATSLEIINYEKNGSKSYALFGFLSVGAFAIVVGAISVIAANWYNIPKLVKLSANLFILLTLGIVFVRSERLNLSYVRETVILLFFGFILGTIALIGQIYHLESHAFKTLSLWLALGTPVILFSRTKYVAHLWAMVVTLWSFMGHAFFFPTNLNLGKIYINFGYVPIVLFLLYILLKKTLLNVSLLPGAILKYATLALLVITMFGGSIRWVVNVTDVQYHHSAAILLLAVPISYYLGRVYSKLAGFLFFFIIGFLEFPNLFTHGSLKVVGATYFLALWTAIAYFGFKINQKKIFEFACTIISIRIIFIYFEVFGSLVTTGFGLIISGAFILLVGYLWHTRREKIWGLR